MITKSTHSIVPISVTGRRVITPIMKCNNNGIKPGTILRSLEYIMQTCLTFYSSVLEKVILGNSDDDEDDDNNNNKNKMLISIIITIIICF